ncbi:UbiD family decarboxylase, partial [Chloroflexota bacterium]
QFRGLPEEQRKAFLFENVIGAKGEKYDMPVLVAAYAGSAEIYALGMMCKPEEIADKWKQAYLHPIEPKIVDSGPVQEVVHMGDNLLEKGGLADIPVPVSTPGFDNGPYMSAPNWVSKEPDTGASNIGVYRAMVKSATRLSTECYHPQHMRMHWAKRKERGEHFLQAAVVIGPTPNVALVGVSKVPYGTDEFSVAGGISGEPVELVKCKTIDVEVPANAEIVIEGEIPTDSLEREGPFGEHTGYVTGWGPNVFLNVTCITHRKNPIYTGYISQFPPSESSKIRKLAKEGTYLKYLKHDCNIPGILDFCVHENSGSAQFCVVKLAKTHAAQPWQALNCIAGYEPVTGKMVIAVDGDIDARDPDSVIWALCYRMQPDRDIRVVPGRLHISDPSVEPMDPAGRLERVPGQTLLIDATMKWPYPPTCLPKKEFMDRAKQIWEEEGLPQLTPKIPWHGYTLGFWPDEWAEEAELAIKGEHFKTGEKLAQQRIKI